MSASFFFYDLETSGISPREARIMQFAGQRTDLQLRPMGDPFNIVIKLTDEVLPDPDAILVTGITPQFCAAEGITEAEFLRIFTDEVAAPDTIFLGYNTVRFDDPFLQFLHYRNFYDPYEWGWKDGRSRWDLLDVIRMTRALRPEGIQWPFAPDGRPSNRLEYLTSVNKLDHSNAHDALSDVNATIAVARLVFNKQGKLFEYLLDMRAKQKVTALVGLGDPFVYSSGRYSSEFEKTTAAVKLSDHPKKQGSALVYDLRHDPRQFTDKAPEELVELLRWKQDRDALRLPVKALQYNRVPAVAPLAVLDRASQARLKLDHDTIKTHHATLKARPDFAAKVAEAFALMHDEQQTQWITGEQEVDAQLYDGFIGDQDKITMSAIRAADPREIGDFVTKLIDPRLKALLPLYKARNYPKLLSTDEYAAWETFRMRRLLGGGEKSRMARYFARIQELGATSLSAQHQHLLQELQLYAESIMPGELA